MPDAPALPAPAATPAVPVATPPAAETPQAPAAAPTAPAQPAAVATPAALPDARPRGPDGKFLPKAGEAAPVAAKMDEPKPADATAPLIPVDWMPKVPEGQKLDEGLLGTFKTIMSDPKTSLADKAQALVEMQLQSRASELKQINEDMQRRRYDDLNVVKGDPEFGGARFDQTIADAKGVLSSFKYGPELSKKLVAYGLDCDPDMTRFLAHVRSLVAEDTTSSRINIAAPVVNGAPKSQIDRQAETYRDQPRR